MHPLGSAEVLDAAVRVVRRNPRAVFTLSVPVAIVRTLVSSGVSLALVSRSVGSGSALLVELAVSGAFTVLLGGLLTPVVAGDLLGRPVSAREAMRDASRGGRGLALLIVLAVAVSVLQVLGLVLLVVGGVWLWGVWAVAGPAMVRERVGLRAALRRSRELTRTRFWRTWAIRTLGNVMTSLLGLLLALPFDIVAGTIGGGSLTGNGGAGVHSPGVYVALMSIGVLLTAAVVAPMTAAIDVLLYCDLRMRREGADIELEMTSTLIVGTAPGLVR